MACSFTATSARSLPALRGRCSARLPRNLLAKQRISRDQTRTFLSLFKKFRADSQTQSAAPPRPILAQDNLFHLFSKSPFPAVRERGEAIKKLAPCPVCASSHAQGHPHVTPKAVKFECPDCGWPTHCSEEHWEADKEHQRFCGRLREASEDEHDLRSGRKMREFEMPGPLDYDETVSFSNWDIFWYTRGFPSMDTERMRRHASKLLTYPMTIASVLHQNSGLTLSNQRVTPEGIRSLAALRSTLHVPPGAPETEEAGVGKPVFRIFILGARAESSLPPHVWEQLSLLFPSVSLHVHFIGPQVSLPKPEDLEKMKTKAAQTAASAAKPEEEAPSSHSNETASPTSEEVKPAASAEPPKPTYVPNIYQPPTPDPIPIQKHTRSSVSVYGAPSYTVPYARQISITGIQASYTDVHPALFDSLDPYSDVFFLFSPGLGFPSASGALTPAGEPVLQISSPTEWGDTLPMLLQSKCSVFVTGFSPADVERDVRALAQAEGVAGEFDWVVTPGENAFGSEKWEVADFDPRVMVKTNWGIWGIRGKRRDIREWEQ
ncbi:zinc-finger of mitochondrial splicing suppressor 51-domain-containing protein [Phellopilus nigrolimitatus]|nr:zinc-finger of mitochondrial splicing suppressor 51-domain-containing protein [Phellopilus nigrolimitatus]